MSGKQRCPCHSRRLYRRCCQPLHQGRPASSPLELMRSRYAAYARSLEGYLIETTHPEGAAWRGDDRAAWHAELQSWCASTRFLGLHILEHEEGPERGMVHFVASLRQGGQDARLEERSLFLKHEGLWRYHSPLSLETSDS